MILRLRVMWGKERAAEATGEEMERRLNLLVANEFSTAALLPTFPIPLSPVQRLAPLSTAQNEVVGSKKRFASFRSSLSLKTGRKRLDERRNGFIARSSIRESVQLPQSISGVLSAQTGRTLPQTGRKKGEEGLAHLPRYPDDAQRNRRNAKHEFTQFSLVEILFRRHVGRE